MYAYIYTYITYIYTHAYRGIDVRNCARASRVYSVLTNRFSISIIMMHRT